MVFKSNPLPRRLITDDRIPKIREVSKNTWNIRNNSQEVNSILCGEFKPEITSKCMKNYFSSHCEGCYCRTGRISPAHLSLADESVECDRNNCKTYKDWKKSRRVVQNNNDLPLGTNFNNNNCNLHKFTIRNCREFDGDEESDCFAEGGGKFKSKFLERHQNNTNNKDDLFEFTKQRKTYENHRANNNANNGGNVGNQGSNNNDDTNKDLNLSNLSNFRDQHYFETHRNPVETPRDHKCVHKFVVNDRLIPEPVNADPFGRSMCSECSKTMPSKRYERQRVSGISPVSTAINTVTGCQNSCQNDAGTMTDCRKFALRAQRLNIGCGDELIELKVPAYLLVNNADGDACRKGFEKRKKVTCCNSMALRFQKCR